MNSKTIKNSKMQKPLIILSIIALLAGSCTQATNKQQIGNKENLLLLKNITIDEDYFRQKTNQSKDTYSQELKEFINQMFLDEESTENLQIIDTIAVSQTYKLLLIGQDNENENWIWLALFDNKNHLFFSEQVYYQDYVEYFYSIRTKIKDNIIQITKSTAQFDDCNVSTNIETKGYIVKNNNLLNVDIDTIPPF